MHSYPLIATLVYLSLTSILAWLYPLPMSLHVFLVYLGWLLLVLGLLVIIIASGQFKFHGTTVNPTQSPDKLLTHGIYRYTRNPMYLGMLLMLLGLPLIREFLPGLLFALTFFLYMDRKQIPAEERRINDIFGADFRDYLKRTRRWL